MKRIIFFLILSVIAVMAMAQSNKSTVRCHFTGLKTDTLILRTVYTSHPDDYTIETIIAPNGRCEFSVADDYAVNVMLAEKNPNGVESYLVADVTLLTILPGENITVNGSIKNKAVIKGSAYADEEKAYRMLTRELNEEIRQLDKERTEKINAGGDHDEVFNEYRPLFGKISMRKLNIAKDYVIQHPDSPYSVYLACLNLSAGEDLYNLLSEKARNGVMKYHIRNVFAYDEERENKRKKLEMLQYGGDALDFTAKDLDGNDLSLSSLFHKGKYVLLDFWGSWCHWCLSAVPRMKAVYEPIKDKMFILSVDCKDTEEEWRKAVKEHDMPWLHVKSEKANDIAALYCVQAYPTFILISPEGKVQKVQIASDDAFYEYVQETVQNISNKTFTVKGTTHGLDDGAKITLATYSRKSVTIDTATVKDGKFSFTCRYDNMVSNNQLIVSYVKPGDKRVWTGIGFFAEPDATVNVFLDIDNLHNNRNAVYGSPLNDRMAAQRKKEDEITKPVLALRKASNNPDLSEQERKKAEREADAIMDKMIAAKAEFALANMDNILGISVLDGFGPSFTVEMRQKMVDMAAKGPFANHAVIAETRKALETEAKTAEGKKFVDLEMAAPDGKIVKLSNFISKNKLTLIDFWASWCAPCRKEIPFMKKVYEDHKALGLGMVGVSFDSEKTNWLNVIKSMNLDYDHMSDLKGWDSVASEVYNIHGIPFTLLVAQDGTIIGRDLHDEKLLKRIKEFLGE